MSAMDATVTAPARISCQPFFNPLVDALLISGLLSLPLVAWSLLGPAYEISPFNLMLIFIIFNWAHFASSTVRFYTKTGEVSRHRFLAFGLPLLMLAAVLAGIAAPDWFGKNLTALFLTWSPYHYAAQAFGISMIYVYRSGIAPSAMEKRWIWWTCMLPFLTALIDLRDRSISTAMGVGGIRWILPEHVILASADWIHAARMVLIPFIFALPLWLMLRGRLPWLAGTLIMTNGLWLVALPYYSASIWITVAHSIQYLCLVTYVHARDNGAQAEASKSPSYYIATFYLLSALVGFLLFMGLPQVIGWTGALTGGEMDMAQIGWMVVVAINLHHFIVDGYIWRSKKPAPRAKPVVETPAEAHLSQMV